MIEVRHLSKHFAIQSGFLRKTTGCVRAVTDVSFSLSAGQVMGVVGESGSGKSTLARTLLRLIEPTAGTILFDGCDITKLAFPSMKTMRRRMQMVFQNPASSLHPRKTVSDILKEPLEFHQICPQHAQERCVEELLDKVGLHAEMASRYPHELSLGQQQRVAIARAISVEPELLVLDESVSALDVSIQAQILNLLMQLQKELAMTYLFISHDLGVVEHIADAVIVMKEGQIVEEGLVEEVLQAPKHPYTQQLLAARLPTHPVRR